MRALRLSGGFVIYPNELTNYDHLWVTHGDHENIEGWPFVSHDEIRQYFANRTVNADETGSTEMPSAPPPPPPPPPPPQISPLNYDIHGELCSSSVFSMIRRNPFCNTKGRHCFLGLNSYEIHHTCIYTYTRNSRNIACRYEDCTESFFSASNFRRHLKSVHGKSRLDCPVMGCKRVGDNGFSREDNLLQHRRKVHKQHIPRTKVRFGIGSEYFKRTILEEPQRDMRVGTFELANTSHGTVTGEDVGEDVGEDAAVEDLEVGDECLVAFRRVE